MSTTSLFLGGVPTKPDVDRLRKAFGVPAIGQLIKYDEIESVLNLLRSTFRFQTVVSAWRKALYSENNCFTQAVLRVGIVVLNPDERIQTSRHGVRRAYRLTGRAVRLAEKTDVSEASPEAKANRIHILDLGARIRLAHATKPKEIELPALK